MTAPVITVSQPESHLWEAANILRGSVNAAMNRLRASASAAFSAEEKLVGILQREGLLK